MCQFFYPDGTKIEKDEFVKFYSKVYYYLYRNLSLEHRMDCILESDVLSRRDLIDILRWKIGAATFDYTSEVVASRRGRIDVGELTDQFGFDRTETSFPKEKFWKDSPEGTLSLLSAADNIGPVYAITLLYFLSKGDYPIYDKFAHIAIKMICEGKDFRQLVGEEELKKEIHRDSDKTAEIFNEYQAKYVERIKSVFQDEYKINRDIDRALWVYGHLFNDTKSNAYRLEE